MLADDIAAKGHAWSYLQQPDGRAKAGGGTSSHSPVNDAFFIDCVNGGKSIDYHPYADFEGTSTINYVIHDDRSKTSSADVTVTINTGNF